MASGSVLLAVSAACTLTGAFGFAAQASVASPLTPSNPTHALAAVAPLALSRPVHAAAHTASVPSSVTVAPGDTLSTISAATCGTASDWSGIYAANRPPLSDPDVISAGQVLRVRCADPGYTPPAPPPAPAPVRQPVQVAAAPAPAQPAAQPAATYSGSGSMQSCIIAAESGGNSQIVNASGHYGLYQFSYATWVAHGGNGADFGHASVAEQNQVYASTVAADGYSDWAPYDGC